jgi:hypothetical protein
MTEPIEFFGPEVTYRWSFKDAPVPRFEMEFTCGEGEAAHVVRKFVDNKPDDTTDPGLRLYSTVLTQAENRGPRRHPSRRIKVRVRALSPTGAPYSHWLEKQGYNPSPALVPVPSLVPLFDQALLTITPPDVPDRVGYIIHRGLTADFQRSEATLVGRGPGTSWNLELPKGSDGTKPNYFFQIACADSFGEDELKWVTVGPVSRTGFDPDEFKDTVTDITKPALDALKEAQDDAQLRIDSAWAILGESEAEGLRRQVALLAESNDNELLVGRIEGLEVKLNGDGTTPGALARLLSAQNAIVTLEGAVATKAESSRVDALDARLGTTEDGLAATNTKLSTVETRANESARSTDLSNLTGTVTTQGQTIAAHGGRLTTVEAKANGAATASEVADLRTTVTGQGTAIGAANTRINTVESTANSANQTASATATSLQTLSNTVGGHTNSISNLNSITTTLDGQVKAQATLFVQAGDRIAGYSINGTRQGTTFNIFADAFRVSNATTSVAPLTIVGNTAQFQNVAISGPNVSLNVNDKFIVDANGNVTIQSGTSGARMLLTQSALQIWDANNRKRVHLGLA